VWRNEKSNEKNWLMRIIISPVTSCLRSGTKDGYENGQYRYSDIFSSVSRKKFIKSLTPLMFFEAPDQDLADGISPVDTVHYWRGGMFVVS
jgi:hypothetical protein